MTKKKREQPPIDETEQPDESLLEELENAPVVQPRVVDGKIVETWVQPKPKS